MNEETNQTIHISAWRTILSQADHRGKYFVLIVGFGAAAGLVQLLTSLLRMYIIDRFLSTMQLRGFLPIAVLFVLIQALYALASYGFGTGSGLLEAHLTADVREKCFRKLQTLSFSFFDKNAVGNILSRLTSDVGRTMEAVSWSLIDVGYGVMSIIGAIIGMFVINRKLAVILILVIPPLALISMGFRQLILKYNRATRRLNSQIISSFNEGITGAVASKTLVLEDQSYGEFRELTVSMRKASFRAAEVSALYMPVASLLISFSTAAVLYIGGTDVLRGLLTIGELNFFMNIGTMMFEPIRNFAAIFAEFQSAQAAAERVAEVLTAEPDVQDSPEVLARYGDVFHPKTENWEPVRGEITFEHVDFRYGAEPVLTDFNLHVLPGQTIALVGETGGGKSTIVNLLCRFYEPCAGRILVDGTDYRDRSQIWLHSALGYVLQTPHLFSGTIRDNIRYGNLEATDAEIRNAARLVGADRFIEKLEKGYNTEVGEGGSLLSTGQKQLISFARAILADPRIFVLDEATSSIDTETEQEIQAAIETLLGSRTSFVVAHRLSTIRNADRILVIDGGKILEQGNHRELMAKKGRYYELYMGYQTEDQIQQSVQVMA
ncbi:MAG: ABC transporter ATP-binding protein [Oscillospiraceae bacterium]|nr:ABC transporter ATP-binding protein [Oscillospiraceae bacterium]